MNLEQLHNKTILFLGKPRAFSQEEFQAQLKQHNITLTKDADTKTRYVLEGRVMNPHEQELVQELHKRGDVTFMEIEEFEKQLAQMIDENVLLMSLKLSQDKERLLSFLKNRCISDTLFFKLLQMYRWSGEDFFENDENRDVTAALIERFYENIERNHNVQFATTGLIHLITQTQNAQLLEVIAGLEPLQFHPDIKSLLATHPSTPKGVIKELMDEADETVLKSLSTNSNVDKEIAKELMQTPKYAQLLASHIVLDEEMFTALLNYPQELAANTTLTPQMQQKLVDLAQESVNRVLACNSALEAEYCKTFYESSALEEYIVKNPATPQEILKAAYVDAPHLHVALAQNPTTPETLLQELYASGDVEVLKALAQNTATPVEILYQLQLDSRYERYVRTNEAFGKHIQTANIGWL